VIHGLPQEDSLWRCYKRWCSTVDKPIWTAATFEGFSLPSAIHQMAEFLAYRRDSGPGSWGDVANHRSAMSTAFTVVFSLSQSPSEDPLISRLLRGIKKINPPQPRYPVDEPAWDPGLIIEYWLGRPDNAALPLPELALKSVSLWAVATFPRPSDLARLVRSKLRRDAAGALRFVYFGTKELRLPVFSVQLSVPLQVQQKVCAVLAVEAYLSRTSGPAFDHKDRVWCSLKPRDRRGIHHAVGSETLSHWVRTVMQRSGVPAHFTGGSIRMAAASRAIDQGWDPRLVLQMGRWKSWHVLNAFYNRAGCRVIPGQTHRASS